MKCLSPGCGYIKHTISNTEGYCCNACKNTSTHGGLCEKINAKKQQKKRRFKTNAATISDVSIYTWGTSKYGKFLIFNFRSSVNTPHITQMNYQILSGTTILDSGAVPYLFNNAQIIYTSQDILNRNVTLAITVAYANNTTVPRATSPPVLLKPRRYINCNYFVRNLNPPTTIPIAPIPQTYTFTSNITETGVEDLYSIGLTFSYIPNDISRITYDALPGNDSIYGIIVFNSNGIPTSDSTKGADEYDYSPLTLQKLPGISSNTIFNLLKFYESHLYDRYNVVITASVAFPTGIREVEYTGIFDWPALETQAET
jgi:hypothetical protein